MHLREDLKRQDGKQLHVHLRSFRKCKGDLRACRARIIRRIWGLCRVLDVFTGEVKTLELTGVPAPQVPAGAALEGRPQADVNPDAVLVTPDPIQVWLLLPFRFCQCLSTTHC